MSRHSHADETEDDGGILRRCLRQLAKQMQRHGEIPADVSEPELYREAEQHLPRMLAAIQRNPM